MNAELLAIMGGVVAASVVGSLHCAGMCGAFVAMAVGIDTRVPRVRLHSAYNLGRLAIYTGIGIVCGSLGGALNIGGDLLGLEQAAIGLAATTMIVIGVVSLLRVAGVRLPRVHSPRAIELVYIRLHTAARRLSPTVRAGVIGLLTGLLPCGWLWAFALLAAGTAHPVAGALVMAAFWLGTLPVLVAVGAGIREVTGRLGAAAPIAMALVIVALGVSTTMQRSKLAFSSFGGEGAANTLPVGLPNHDEPLPCCHSKPDRGSAR
ncbi:MAG: sulfite exporter TauE/SafE family protein [Planctomycetota bacterium]